MKRLTLILILTLALIPVGASAAVYSWDRPSVGRLNPLGNILDTIFGNNFIGTSTTATSTFPILEATNRFLGAGLTNCHGAGNAVTWNSSTWNFGCVTLQVTGNYITALTGDVTASGPGSAVTTLATVNLTPSTYTNSTVTVNGKGLVTSATSGATPEVPLTFVYPIVRTVNAISLAFGTTTSNTWSGTQTFTNSPLFSTLGAGTVNSTAGGTTYSTGTSTPAVGLGLAYSGTLGQFISGVSGTLTIATSSLYTGTTGQFPYFNGTNALIGTSTIFLDTTGRIGIGTTTPGRLFSVQGDALISGNMFVANVTATGTVITTNLTVGTLTGPLQAISGVVSASSSLSVAYGGTGSTTSLGGILAGNGFGAIKAVIIGSGLAYDGTTLSSTGGTGGGLATSAPIASSNLLVYSSVGAGSAYGIATSTLTASGPLTGSFVQIGTGGMLGCTTAAAGVAGCLNSTDWSLFNNKISSTSLSAGVGIGYVPGTGVISNMGVTSIVAGNNITISSGTGAVTVNTVSYPFYTLTNYGTTTQATGTPMTFVGGITSSSSAIIASSSWQVLLTDGSTFGGYILRAAHGSFYIASTSVSNASSTSLTSFAITASSTGSLMGINTATPRATLDLYEQNGIGASPSVLLGGNTGGDTDYWLSRITNNDGVSNDNFEIGSGTVPGLAPLFTVATTGNVGVGTTSPYGLFSVNAPAGNSTPEFVIGSSSGEIMSVRSNNQTLVGIGTTSPWRGLSVATTAAFSGLSSASAGNALCINATTFEAENAGTQSCTISSIRYKTNVKPFDGTHALSILKDIDTYSYDYKKGYYSPEDSSHGYGPIAEYVLKSHPELVDKKYDGSAGDIFWNKLTGLNTDAINELNARIDTLQPNKYIRSAEENWQWGAIGFLVLWNLYLTCRRKRV